MKDLLVMSVFTDGERTPTWYKLQCDYLKKTTTSYDHAVCLYRANRDIFTDSIIVRNVPYGQLTPREEHSTGLNALRDYARLHADEYRNFLFLDSDAFPILPGWQRTLLGFMNKASKASTHGTLQFAAVQRSEFLSQHPHPAAMFIRGNYINSPNINFNPVRILAMLGRIFQDPGTGIKRGHMAGKNEFLPLVRTNAVNIHPLLGGIYGGMFYHHGAGSRTVHLMAVTAGYYDHIVDPLAHVGVERFMYEQLTTNTETYLNTLSRFQLFSQDEVANVAEIAELYTAYNRHSSSVEND